MCPPTLYDVNYVINPWMAGNVNRSSREHATKQWNALHSALGKIADVLLVQPQPGSPDMVFTANAGLVFDGKVALSSFYHPERRMRNRISASGSWNPVSQCATSPA